MFVSNISPFQGYFVPSTIAISSGVYPELVEGSIRRGDRRGGRFHAHLKIE